MTGNGWTVMTMRFLYQQDLPKTDKIYGLAAYQKGTAGAVLSLWGKRMHHGGWRTKVATYATYAQAAKALEDQAHAKVSAGYKPMLPSMGTWAYCMMQARMAAWDGEPTSQAAECLLCWKSNELDDAQLMATINGLLCERCGTKAGHHGYSHPHTLSTTCPKGIQISMDMAKLAQPPEDCEICQTRNDDTLGPNARLARLKIPCIECWLPLGEHKAVHPHPLPTWECPGATRPEPGQTAQTPVKPTPTLRCGKCGTQLQHHHDETATMVHPWRNRCDHCNRLSHSQAMVHRVDCPMVAVTVKAKELEILADSNRPMRKLEFGEF